MPTIQQLIKTIQPGRRVFVRADDLGLDADAFHTLALEWVAGKTEGFSVMGEPHYEKFVKPPRIDVMWLMRDAG